MGPVLSVAMASVPPTVTSTPPSSSATAVPRPRQVVEILRPEPVVGAVLAEIVQYILGESQSKTKCCMSNQGSVTSTALSVMLCPQFLSFMLAVVGVDSMNSIDSEMVVSTGQVVPAVSAVLLLLLELYTHTPWMIYEPSYFLL